jgi:enoyl-CoA hydratase/carnithine racemase
MRPYEKIKVTREGAACTIRLNVPERRNAIGPQMTNELLYAFEDAVAAEDVRVIVLAAEGKVFCAGGDFGQMTSGADGPKLPPKGDYADLLLAMVRTQKPIVAKVQGAAMGGGLGLVAASTFSVVSSEAKLGTPEVDVGLFPMMIMAVLARNVPRRRLLQMMLLGEKITAEEGERIGLVNRVVAPDGLDAATTELVTKIAGQSPTAMRLGLKAFAEQDEQDLATALPMLSGKLAEILGTEDAREGLMAFMEKRTPQWKGK